jgi:hypothetical protein
MVVPNKLKITRIVLLSILFLAVSATAFGQYSYNRKEKTGWGYGASIIYNFQTEGFGADLRVRIPLVKRLYAVPEVSYFPGFNEYHELYAGAALQYDLLNFGKWHFYILGAGYYNDWINADDFAPGQKKRHNFAPEAGGGLVRNNGCLRPFIENRYDFKWKEDNLRIGIYWYPGSCSGSGNRKDKCPAYGT